MSVSSELEQLVASGEFARMVGRQPASARAYSGGSTTFAIGNVARVVGRASHQGLGGNITVSATSLSALSTPLTLEMDLSGRPLAVAVSGVAQAGASGTIILDILVRGVSVAGVTNGVAYITSTATAVSFFGADRLMEPSPGPAVIEVVAMRLTADGTIYTDANNRIVLLAEEL